MKIEVIPGKLTVESMWVAAIEVFGHMPHQSMTITLHGGAQFHASKSDHPDFSATKVLGEFHQAELDLGEAEGKVRMYDVWAPQIESLTRFCVRQGYGQIGDDVLPVAESELRRKAHMEPISQAEMASLNWAIDQALSWQGGIDDKVMRDEHNTKCNDAWLALKKLGFNA